MQCRKENNKQISLNVVCHVNINGCFSSKLSDCLEHRIVVRIANKTRHKVVYNISLSVKSSKSPAKKVYQNGGTMSFRAEIQIF